MRAAVWVVGVWVGMSALFLLGWACGHRLGLYKGLDEREEVAREWRILFDELGVEHGAAIDKLEAELAEVKRDRSKAWDDAFMFGQVWRAEREAEGL